MGFFEDVLPRTSGWVPLMTLDPDRKMNPCSWFLWPEQGALMAGFVQEHSQEDVYFSPMLYTKPPSAHSARHAAKANVTAVACVYADGDDCPLDSLRATPTTIVQSSRDRWQGYWRLDETISPAEVEALSHSVSAAHKDEGMDSGWALAKRLRVPFSMNTKPSYGMAWEVTYDTQGKPYSVEEFSRLYDPYEALEVDFDRPMPKPGTTNDAIDELAKFGVPEANTLFLFEPAPGQDWSRFLYRLECILWEAGATMDQVFLIAGEAECNKFVRDHRPPADFWRQLLLDRARWEAHNQDYEAERPVVEIEGDEDAIETPSFRDENAAGLFWSNVSLLRKGDVVPNETFLDAFVTWVRRVSPQTPEGFAVAGGLSLLASTLARYGKLPLSFGDVGLNIYTLVLGRTTQSRKTTALLQAKRVLREVTDNETERYLVPEDVTPEALNEYLATLARLSGVFAVDEVQGLFEAVNKTGGYQSGLIHLLTNAYGGTIPGVLRKSSGQKHTPPTDYYLSFYGTGIMDQTARALTPARIESGFVPRCLIVIDERSTFTTGAWDVRFRSETDGVSDNTMLKFLATWLGRGIRVWEEQRQADLQYASQFEDVRREITISDEAFARWQRFAEDVTVLAKSHPLLSKYLFPICERMYFSVLKVAALLAMASVDPSKKTSAADLGRIEIRHVVKAIALADTWVRCTEIFVQEVTNSGLARDIREVEAFVASRPQGAVPYRELMSRFQASFDSPRRFEEVLEFCRKKGSLRDVVRSKRAGDRYVQYVPSLG